MSPLAQEWVDKAEGDFHSALRELRARKNPNPDSAAFHAQQCAEKYIKARLQEAGIGFPFTHDLEVLLRLVAPVEPLWVGMQPGAKKLTFYAVKSRYPGSSVSRAQAKEAVTFCREVRARARQGLQLPP